MIGLFHFDPWQLQSMVVYFCTLWARFFLWINMLYTYIVYTVCCIHAVSLGMHSQWHDVSQWQESAAYGSKQILWWRKHVTYSTGGGLSRNHLSSNVCILVCQQQRLSELQAVSLDFVDSCN